MDQLLSVLWLVVRRTTDFAGLLFQKKSRPLSPRTHPWAFLL